MKVSRSLSTVFSLFFVLLFSPWAYSQPPTTLGGFYLTEYQQAPDPLKLTYVRVLMEQNGRYNIVFTQTAEFYRDRLNELAEDVTTKKDDFVRIPLAHHFAAVAVIHCDWKNDFEKLDFAEQYLGEAKLTRYGVVFPEALLQLRQNCPQDSVVSPSTDSPPTVAPSAASSSGVIDK